MLYNDITLDLNRISAAASMSVKQGDTGRRIRIRLTDGSSPYRIPDGCHAVFSGKKPDGKVLWNPCVIEGDTIVYETTLQTVAVVGVVTVEIRLYNADGRLLVSPDFALIVAEPAVADSEMELISENEITTLTELVTEASALIESVEARLANGDFVGEAGGYYTPTVTQEGDGDVALGFEPSKSDMPPVEDVPIEIHDEETEATIRQLVKDVADLKYVAIDITSVSNSVGTAEMGATVNAVTITWALNKDPVSQTVDGTAVDPAERSVTLEGLTVTAAKTFTVTVADERDATDTATTKINFYNGVYCGPLASGVVPDSAAILALTRKLQSGRGVTINYTPADGKRPSYACPTRYGTPRFVIGGFEYAWMKLGTIEFENASGYTESYDVWQHPQDVTGSITVNVT